MGKHIFLSYATGNFIEARDQLCQSAIDVGFDIAIAKTYDDLDQKFRDKNHGILSQTRGAGYWLWKPQIILQELQKLDKDDVLVYSDAGRSTYYQFRSFPKHCISLTKKHGFLLGPTIGQHGPMSKWTKRDAFVLLEMDRPEIHNLPPIQATYSFWTPCKEAFEFLEIWIKACEDPRILTDIPNTQNLKNLSDFVDHRHDQSILSLLAYKHKAFYINYHMTFIEYILLKRPQSEVSNLIFKRIYDVEKIKINKISNNLFYLFKSYFDLKFFK